ncbi:MAG TPA: siderophore-interacting protein [Kineosporiaceae bacterium]|nr:siderophore-interacting protein [Kineosporiaceae bacterium]
MPAEPAYLLFQVQVRAVTRLTPTFVRVTFTGAQLDQFADHGDDQRINLVLPGPDGEPLRPADVDDWYSHWLKLPEERRNPLRTYTVRRVRAEQREVDVDFALHGDGGPASRWAGSVAVGDAAQLAGPNLRHAGPTRATGWNPPLGDPTLLIVGDETALPAVASILEGLPASARGTVLLEVPEPGDVLPLTAPAGVPVEWLPRSGAEHGVLLAAAVRQAAAEMLGGASQPVEPVEPGEPGEAESFDEVPDELWDVPEPDDQPSSTAVYAWLAGEAGCITGLRRHLVKELGMDRRSVAFMGYWREGVARNNS